MAENTCLCVLDELVRNIMRTVDYATSHGDFLR